MTGSNFILGKFCRIFGLHPLVGFGMFAVDWMLFGSNVSTVGLGLLITTPIALLLSIPCILLQRYMFHDNWGAALGKGLMVGVLTAVPSPLPSVVPFASGAIGTAKVLRKRNGTHRL